MKKMKRLLSSLLALLLVFCSLSAGMTVLAAEETEEPEEGVVAVAPTPFASFTAGGTKVDFTKAKDYHIQNYNKGSAKVEWKANDGWNINVSYYSERARHSVELKSGDSVPVKKNELVEIDVLASNEYSTSPEEYSVNIYRGKPGLVGMNIWMGVKEVYLEPSGIRGSTKVVSIKSSKKAVLGVRKGETLGNCTVIPKKPGSAKVTVVVQINGKKQSFSANYTVKKFPNALKELKVNNTKVNLKKHKFGAEVKTGKNKVKVKYKIAKGWKVKCVYYNGNKDVSLKSGGTVSTPKWVFFFMTKGKDEIQYMLQLYK